MISAAMARSNRRRTGPACRLGCRNAPAGLHAVFAARLLRGRLGSPSRAAGLSVKANAEATTAGPPFHHLFAAGSRNLVIIGDCGIRAEGCSAAFLPVGEAAWPQRGRPPYSASRSPAPSGAKHQEARCHRRPMSCSR
jgi:hypothetical protein